MLDTAWPDLFSYAASHTEVLALPLPSHPDRIMVTDEGDVLAPDGYDLQLSRHVRRVLRRKSPETIAKYLPWLRLFFRFELVAGEGPYAFLHEDWRRGVKRLQLFFESIGLVVEPDGDAVTGGFQVSHPSAIAYLRNAITVVHQFYTRICSDLRDPANPADINGWHKMDVAARLEWAIATNYNRRWGIKHAGNRFRVMDAKTSPPALDDATTCGPEMVAALIAHGAPESVVDLGMVQEENGVRIGDIRKASALWWRRGGLEDVFYCRSKGKGRKLVKPATMPALVHEHVVGRFETQPHPTDPGKTMMDHIRELSEAGNETVLSKIYLFPRPGKLVPYGYHGYRYWISGAMEMQGVLIRTTEGSRQPTSQWWRHAAISADMRELFESTDDEALRKAGKKRICEDYHLDSDQTERYAAFEYERDAKRRARAKARRRNEREAARRANIPITPHTLRLAMPAAEQAFEAMPARSA